MTTNQRNNFKELLEAKQAGLMPSAAKRDEIAIERAADMLDAVMSASDRELATRKLDREAKSLRDVRAALSRIQNGTYGTCIHCEEEIGMRRLNAVPWASLCIKCQDDADKGVQTATRSGDYILAEAA
jgi:DnaK suppressor protein